MWPAWRRTVEQGLAQVCFRSGQRAGALLLALSAIVLPAAAQAAETLFNGGTVPNCTYVSASKTYSCTALPLPAYNDSVNIASGYTVVVSSSVAFGYNQGLKMSGTARLEASGNLDIGDINPSNLTITGGNLVAGGNFKIGAQVQTITADVKAATMSIGTGSTTRINGTLTATGDINLASNVTIVGAVTSSNGAVNTNAPLTLRGDVTAAVAFTLPSGSTLTGNAKAPTVVIAASGSTVTGNITASTSLRIESGNTVNGNIKSGDLTLAPSGTVVNGAVDVNGNIVMGSGDTINGNVVATGKVTLQDSSAYIRDNLSASSVVLGWDGRVGQYITCTGPSVSPTDACSCVTNNSGHAYNSAKGPKCTPPQAGGLHHYLLSYAGPALTCQGKAVTVTACANAACTTPHYGGGATVTLAPDPQASPIVIGSTGIAQGLARRYTAGTATVGVASSTVVVPNATTCRNTSNNATDCALVFSDRGLTVTIDDHTAGSNADVAIQALENVNGSCVPMFAGKTMPIKFDFAYVNPASGTLAPRIGTALPQAGAGSANACASASSASVRFNSAGAAEPKPVLTYADTGALTVRACHAASGQPDVTGDDGVIVAPAGFTFSAIGTPAAGSTAAFANPSAADHAGRVFARAGQRFNATLTAVNTAGAATPNFGKETTASRIAVSHTRVAPATNAGGVDGVFSSGTAGPFSQGATVVADLAWSEVGIVTLTAKLSKSGLYASLANSVLDASTRTSANIGRFVPDHFDTALAPVCIEPDSATQPACLARDDTMACPPGIAACLNGRFIYARQPFSLVVSAVNADGTVTANYQGLYAHALTVEGWNKRGATGAANKNPEYLPGATSALTNTATGAANPAPGIVFSKGIGVGKVSYAFSAIHPATAALLSRPADVVLRALENDDGFTVTSARGDTSVEAGLTVGSGRLRINNNYGSPLLPLTLEATAQYWNGTAYVNNRAFVREALPLAGQAAFSQCSKTLASDAARNCTAAVALETNAVLHFKASPTPGTAAFRLAAPGAGQSGSARIDINALTPYLPSLPGVGTFGIYRSPLIYMREVY